MISWVIPAICGLFIGGSIGVAIGGWMAASHDRDEPVYP